MAYSFEIDNKLKERNYNLSSEEYLELFNPSVSTQITRVLYNPWDNYFSCWTNDGYHWRFTVYPVVIYDNVDVPHDDIFKVKERKKR